MRRFPRAGFTSLSSSLLTSSRTGVTVARPLPEAETAFGCASLLSRISAGIGERASEVNLRDLPPLPASGLPGVQGNNAAGQVLEFNAPESGSGHPAGELGTVRKFADRFGKIGVRVARAR